MKKSVIYVKIALHFAKMKVVDLLPFAKGIRDKIAVDPDIVIDPLVQADNVQEIIDLEKTVVLRESDTSKALTKQEAKQATTLINTLTLIAQTTESKGNKLFPGDVPTIQNIFLRIGFGLFKVPDITGRFFEIFKTAIATVYIRVKADKKVNLYHWRWSPDDITWIRLSDTTVASIIIFGLPSGKVSYFQNAVSLKAKKAPKLNATPEEPEWGDSISEMIP